MSQILMLLFTMSFISWSNGLNLQVYDSLDILESKYNQLISQRLSSGSFNTKATSNVILFLVEGLDSHTMSAARKITRETTPTNAMDTLDNFITGLIKPHSRDHMVGDPASSSSSIFSGLPERNGQMGWIKQENNTCLKRDQSKKVANLFKTMSAAGKYTALIATAPLTSPGVAGTYASSPDMKLESDIHVKEAACNGFTDIARQLIMEHRQLNVIVGTGRNYFHFKNKTDELTGKLLPDARSDIDLKDIWSVNLRVKHLPHKVAIGKASVSAALASETNDYVLGFLEEKDDLELTSQNVKDVITGFKKKSLKNSRGYFITVYIDQIARAHDASQGLKAAKYLETILRIVKDVHGLVKTDDTLLLVASTQGSTLTVGSGAYIDENLGGYTKTEECQSYRFLNYAFGVEKAPKFDTVPGDPEYKFPSLYFAQGTTGGPDLPIFATGTSAGLFTGVNTFPYIHHAILCATCLAKNAKDIYPHCPTPTTTTPALTTTTTTTTTSTTTTSTTTVTPTVKTTTRKPQSPFWPWYFQPYPGKGPNPYANMISRNDINSPASSSNARPQPVPMNPTPRPAQQQSNNFFGSHAFSWLPFLL